MTRTVPDQRANSSSVPQQLGMTPERHQAGVPTVIYVGGYGRSGSTILGMLLGMQAQTCAPGELARIFEVWPDNYVCSCMKGMQDCVFWSQVMARFQAELPHITWGHANRVTAHVEHMRSTPLTGRRPSGPIYEEYRQIWRAMLPSIATVGGASVIVDTSKSSYRRANRPLALASLGEADVKFIHLIRDPRAVMWSQHSAAQTKRVRPRFTFEATLVNWLLTNVYLRFFGRSPYFASTVVTYERLTQRPTVELARMGADLGLDMSELIELVAAERPIVGKHLFEGNAIRIGEPVVLRADTPRWLGNLPRSAKWLAMLSWPLVRHYGYSLTRSRKPIRTESRRS